VAATRALLEPLVAARGITRVADLTELDLIGVPVLSAIRPGAATLVASAGKGRDMDSAWVSAVMESLEVRAAERFSPSAALRTSAAALAPGYAARDLALHPLSLVDEKTTLAWTRAADLTGGSGFVPTAAIGLRGWTEERWSPPLFLTSSNGLAGGNDTDEATVHGLLELVERDALRRAAAGAARLPVDPASLRGSAALARRAAEAGGVIELERIDSLPGTTAFVSYLTQEELPQIFGGTGCHVDAAWAAERAILEAIQSRASFISGLRDDLPAIDYRPLGPASSRSPRRVVDSPLSPTATPAPSIAELQAALVEAIASRTGKPVLCVDLTPSGEPFPAVVQTFAPGLQPSPDAPAPLSTRRRRA
jgi:ribosomal protein S12 methylthiotransferase accessory factor